MNHIEYIGCNLKQLLDEEIVRYILRVFIDCVQHFRILLESLSVEFLVCVDFVAFCLKDPTQGLGVHVVYIAFMKLKRIVVVLEYFIVVYLREVLAK